MQYEAEKFNYLASISLDGKIFELSPKLQDKTLDGLRKAKGLKGGGTTAKGALALAAAVMFEVFRILRICRACASMQL